MLKLERTRAMVSRSQNKIAYLSGEVECPLYKWTGEGDKDIGIVPTGGYSCWAPRWLLGLRSESSHRFEENLNDSLIEF